VTGPSLGARSVEKRGRPLVGPAIGTRTAKSDPGAKSDPEAKFDPSTADPIVIQSASSEILNDLATFLSNLPNL
jgi:hypothetical protein